jgi:hypothetical protein
VMMMLLRFSPPEAVAAPAPPVTGRAVGMDDGSTGTATGRRAVGRRRGQDDDDATIVVAAAASSTSSSSASAAAGLGEEVGRTASLIHSPIFFTRPALLGLAVEEVVESQSLPAAGPDGTARENEREKVIPGGTHVVPLALDCCLCSEGNTFLV